MGEALQNALDAVVMTGGGQHRIDIELDLDKREVSVLDTGVGFPNDPSLLFLGGGRKKASRKNLFGQVGVGIKVVLFASKQFVLRGNDGNEAFRYEVKNAFKFNSSPPPNLPVGKDFKKDPQPLSKRGTEVTYSFPQAPDDPIAGFFQDVRDACLGSDFQPDAGYAKTLKRAVDNGEFDSRLSALLVTYFRRFTYAGDVLALFGGKPELADTIIGLTVTCSDPQSALGSDLGDFFDGKSKVAAEFSPTFLRVDEVIGWVKPPKPGIVSIAIGPGGGSLSRTAQAIDSLIYAPSEFDQLLTRKDGNLSPKASEFQRSLYGDINGILLSIGRIPHLDEFLPGGSQRLVSANGVVTTHEIPLVRGRNQQYVRCLDLVVDVDADLNYGKSQLTNMHLVKRVRDFVDDAYSTTLQNAAGNWVGKISTSQPTYDQFLSRKDLGVDELVARKEPRDENDVIALFFELCARGHLTGYHIYGLSQVDQYDARGVIKPKAAASFPSTPQVDQQLSIIEFKTEAARLISDLESKVKYSTDIQLLVAWSEGRSTSNAYHFADIVHHRDHPAGIFDGVSRFLQDTQTGAEIQVLLLKDLIADLKAKQKQ